MKLAALSGTLLKMEYEKQVSRAMLSKSGLALDSTRLSGTLKKMSQHLFKAEDLVESETSLDFQLWHIQNVT